jgi:hypothetical protein
MSDKIVMSDKILMSDKLQFVDQVCNQRQADKLKFKGS